MNKEKLIANWDNLTDETKTNILALADKEIKEDWFVPKEGDKYYYSYFHDIGKMSFIDRISHNNNFDIFNIETGNCFRTPEEAIFYGNCDYYTKRFETFVNRHSDKLDWKDDNQDKHYVFYHFDDRVVRFSRDSIAKTQGTVYADSIQIIKDAIADIGEENFLKYVMKVEK